LGTKATRNDLAIQFGKEESRCRYLAIGPINLTSRSIFTYRQIPELS